MKTSSNQSSEASAPTANSRRLSNPKDTSNNNSFSSSSYNEKEEKGADKNILKKKNVNMTNNASNNTFVHFGNDSANNKGPEVKKNQKKVNNVCFSELYIAPNKFINASNKEILRSCDALISNNTLNHNYRSKVKQNNMYNHRSLNVSKNPSENSLNVNVRHDSNAYDQEALTKKARQSMSPKTR